MRVGYGDVIGCRALRGRRTRTATFYNKVVIDSNTYVPNDSRGDVRHKKAGPGKCPCKRVREWQRNVADIYRWDQRRDAVAGLVERDRAVELLACA